MSDRDVDRLLSGKAPEGDEALAELAALVRNVKSVYGQAPSEQTAKRHLAAMAEATRFVNEEAAGQVRTPGRSSWRAKLMPTPLRSTTKIALASVASLLVMSGLAVASALPDPVQSAVAGAADQVGISLDNPDEPDGNNNVDDRDARNADDGEVGKGGGGDLENTTDDRFGGFGQSGEGESGQSGGSSGGGESGQSGGSSGGGESGQSGGSSGGGESGQSGGSSGGQSGQSGE